MWSDSLHSVLDSSIHSFSLLSHSPKSTERYSRACRPVWHHRHMRGTVIATAAEPLCHHWIRAVIFLLKIYSPFSNNLQEKERPEKALFIFSSYQRMTCKIVYKCHSFGSIQNTSLNWCKSTALGGCRNVTHIQPHRPQRADHSQQEGKNKAQSKGFLSKIH